MLRIIITTLNIILVLWLRKGGSEELSNMLKVTPTCACTRAEEQKFTIKPRNSYPKAQGVGHYGGQVCLRE